MSNQRFLISCVEKDSKGVITRVGGQSGWRLTVADVATRISNGSEAYYIQVNGRAVDVDARISSAGNYYLVTKPDGVSLNNLDNLQRCG